MGISVLIAFLSVITDVPVEAVRGYQIPGDGVMDSFQTWLL